ncbi:MAG: HalOD1 output domain-containing protein [Haloarculaceae archaeon]
MSASANESGDAMQRRRAVSEAIVEAVAAVEGGDPLELSPPLAAAVDADAIDALFASAAADARLAVDLRVWGHAVRVGADGGVYVDGERVTTVARTD